MKNTWIVLISVCLSYLEAASVVGPIVDLPQNSGALDLTIRNFLKSKKFSAALDLIIKKIIPETQNIDGSDQLSFSKDQIQKKLLLPLKFLNDVQQGKKRTTFANFEKALNMFSDNMYEYYELSKSLDNIELQSYFNKLNNFAKNLRRDADKILDSYLKSLSSSGMMYGNNAFSPATRQTMMQPLGGSMQPMMGGQQTMMQPSMASVTQPGANFQQFPMLFSQPGVSSIANSQNQAKTSALQTSQPQAKKCTCKKMNPDGTYSIIETTNPTTIGTGPAKSADQLAIEAASALQKASEAAAASTKEANDTKMSAAQQAADAEKEAEEKEKKAAQLEEAAQKALEALPPSAVSEDGIVKVFANTSSVASDGSGVGASSQSSPEGAGVVENDGIKVIYANTSTPVLIRPTTKLNPTQSKELEAQALDTVSQASAPSAPQQSGTITPSADTTKATQDQAFDSAIAGMSFSSAQQS